MKRLMFAVAVVGLAAVPGVAQDRPDAGATGNSVEADQAAAAIIADCSARKFETSIELVKDGKPSRSKVKLCGKQGQTDAQWANTLKDAAKKVEANEKMPQMAKEQLITALQAEIAKFEPVSAASIELPVAPPPPATQPPEFPVSSQLPNASVATTSVAAATPAKKPRVTIRCLAPGDKGTGSTCTSLDRTTQLSIRADEDLAGGVGLRFLRRGDKRGEIDLAQMRQGQIIRSKLPPGLCAGVASTQIQIQVMGSNDVAETLGPFKLRC